MDISSLIGTLMSADSTQGIGQTTNTNSSTVQNVLTAALPALLDGAKTQSQDTSTGFAQALLSHGQKDTSDIAAFLNKVDLIDGGKIVGHLLGSNSGSQISSIASSAGASKKDTSSILAAAAPLLMSLLGQQSAANTDSGAGTDAIGAAAALLLKNLDVGSILGSLLGVSSSGKKGKKGLLGAILGKLLKK